MLVTLLPLLFTIGGLFVGTAMFAALRPVRSTNPFYI